jgi:hypothetical protein
MNDVVNHDTQGNQFTQGGSPDAKAWRSHVCDHRDARMMVILALLVLTTPTPTTVGDTDAGRRRPDIRRAEESP